MSIPIDITAIQDEFLKPEPKTLGQVTERLARALEAALYALDLNEEYANGERSVKIQNGLDLDAWAWGHQAHKAYSKYAEKIPLETEASKSLVSEDGYLIDQYNASVEASYNMSLCNYEMRSQTQATEEEKAELLACVKHNQVHIVAGEAAAQMVAAMKKNGVTETQMFTVMPIFLAGVKVILEQDPEIVPFPHLHFLIALMAELTDDVD